MTRTTRTGLRVETLEARDCPALTVIFSGSNLYLRGTPVLSAAFDPTQETGLDLDLAANGGLRVREVTPTRTIDYGSYLVTGNVQLDLDYYNTNINLNLGGHRLPGNVTMNLGRGDINTSFTSFNPISLYNGAIGGNLSIRGGSGLEFMNLGLSGFGAQPALPLDVGGFVTVTGSSGTNSNDLFGVGDQLNVNDGTLLRKDLITNQIDSIILGDAITNGGRVNGGVVLNVARSGNEGNLSVFGQVGGNVTFVGSDIKGALNAGERVVVRTGSQVSGNVTAVFGQGLSFLTVENGGTVLGCVTDASGNDAALIDVEGNIFGSLSASLGNGANLILLGGFIGGNADMTAGNGGDTVIVTGAIAGHLRMHFGNGDNSLEFDGTLGGPDLQYTGGSGQDSVTINGTNSFTLYAWLGAGADTLTISQSDGLGGACIDFGLDFDADVFNPPPLIGFHFKMTNFP
jgi:hypothetical protein